MAAVQGRHGVERGGPPTTTLKQKKSLDWLSKGFKRMGSASSLSSNASSVAGTGKSSSGGSDRGGAAQQQQHLHHLAAGGGGAGTGTARFPGTSPGEQLLTIPGSPRETDSFGSSSDSQSFDLEKTVIIPSSSIHLGNTHSNNGSSGGGGSPLTPDAYYPSDEQSTTSSSASASLSLKLSPFPSPLPSPSKPYFSTLQVVDHAAADPSEGGRPRSGPRSGGGGGEDDSKTPVMLSAGFDGNGSHSDVKARAATTTTSRPSTSTSEPLKHSNSESERLLLSLSSRKVLRAMLDDPVGLWKFGQFLASEMNAETLVFWLNAEQHRNDLKRLYSLTQRIHSLHIPSNAPLALNITSNERASIEHAIRSFTRADDPFKVARDTAFQALYHDSWPRFLQWRLELLQAKLRQGGLSPPQTSFTLADPSQDRDQPLLLASDGFLDLSGYSRDDVLKRNCRFLQGPGTSPLNVARIRQACATGTEVTELLLNYRKDGVPFWSLLRIIPLRNASGKLKYLLGAQVNVTSVLAATQDLAHLLDDEIDPVEMPPRPPFAHDLAESQKQMSDEAMKAYLVSLDRQHTDPHKKSDAERRDIANKATMFDRMRLSPKLSPGSPAQPGNSPKSTANGLPAPGGAAQRGPPSPNQPRPRSAHRDMHLHAAAALAFDGTMGTAPSKPAQWSGVPSTARPATTGSLFQRPNTAYSMVDNDSRAQTQLSLAEQTKAFNESSSYYMILDSQASVILFHSANLPTGIAIGAEFGNLVGAKIHKRLKEQVRLGDRLDIDSVKFNIAPFADSAHIWRDGVRVCMTPLKDQINEVGAVVILIQSPLRRPVR